MCKSPVEGRIGSWLASLIYMLPMTIYCVEDPFEQFRTAALAMLSHISFLTSSLLGNGTIFLCTTEKSLI